MCEDSVQVNRVAGIAVHRVYDIARTSPAIARFEELWLYVLCETVSHRETGRIELDKREF